jgi:hypothetical protein
LQDFNGCTKQLHRRCLNELSPGVRQWCRIKESRIAPTVIPAKASLQKGFKETGFRLSPE